MSVSSPVSPIVDQLADLALWEAELAADPQVVASSLADRLASQVDEWLGDLRAVRNLKRSTLRN